jgi:hypothetical protein
VPSKLRAIRQQPVGACIPTPCGALCLCACTHASTGAHTKIQAIISPGPPTHCSWENGGSRNDSLAFYRSPVPSCHFYVGHKYKAIFVRTTKTAGTTVSHTLGIKENPALCK